MSRGNPSVVIRLDADHRAMLEEICQRESLDRSTVIRLAIMYYHTWIMADTQHDA